GDLKLDASGDINAQTNKIINVVDPTTAQDAATKAYVDSNSISEVVDDSSPQLGGNLDVNGNQILSTSNGNIIIKPNGTGKVGIGTTNPTEKLTVNGNIEFESNTQSLKFAAGNSATNSIEVNSGSGPRASIDFLGVASSQSTDIVFKTSETSATSAERMRIKTSTGRIGIGTSAPASILHAYGSYPTVKVENNNTAQYASASIELQGVAGNERITKLLHGNSNTGGTETYFKIEQYDSNGTFVKTLSNYDYQFDFWGFNTAGNERLRIDSSGKVGIGTTSPETPLHVNGNILSSTSTTSSLTLRANVNNGNDSSIKFEKTRSGGDVQDNDDLGTVQWFAYYGGAYQEAASIRGEVELGSGSLEGELLYSSDRHYFRTDSTTRMVIDEAGDVGIGTDSPDAKLNVSLDNTDTSVYFHGGGIRGLKINDETITNNGDHTKFTKSSATGEYSFSNSSEEIIRFKSDGNVGIGTTSPGSRLHIKGSAGERSRIHIESVSSGASGFIGSGSGLLLTAGGMNTTSKFTPAIQFGSTDGNFTTTNPKIGAAINAIAQETFSADTDGGMDLAFYTTPNNPGTGQTTTERMRILSSGGITFNGDTANANALDDYEEGTWTPGIEGATTAGSYTFTSTGAYTKVGNKVTVWGELTNITTVSLGSGITKVTGLPFTNPLGFDAIGSILLDQWDLTSTAIKGLAAQLINNVNYMQPRLTRNGATDTGLQITDKTNNNADIRFCITYTVA
uniref:hypothetical protein n=1 Tax=Limnobacter sp. TaxID=2003368 RepID=UPI0025BE7324